MYKVYQILTIDELKKKLKNKIIRFFFNAKYILLFVNIINFYRVKCLIPFLLESNQKLNMEEIFKRSSVLQIRLLRCNVTFVSSKVLEGSTTRRKSRLSHIYIYIKKRVYNNAPFNNPLLPSRLRPTFENYYCHRSARCEIFAIRFRFHTNSTRFIDIPRTRTPW